MRFLVIAVLSCACSSMGSVSPTQAGLACVDVRSDAVRRSECDPKVTPGCDVLRQQTVDDLDGDGVSDALVAQEDLCGATGNCPYFVYLTGSGCAHYAGEAGGVLIHAEKTSHAGVRDLSGYWKGGCVAMEGTGSRWAFDGKEYRVIDSYSCECPYSDMASDTLDPKLMANRDPRCPGP